MLSVIVPVLDEEQQIDGLLAALGATPGLGEIIVVDGGSRDRTTERVRAATGSITLVESARGRATQMNAGAAAARGEIFLFLHADCRLPTDAAAWIERVLLSPDVVAGAFRTWTLPDERAPRAWLGRLLHLADLRSRYAALPYGDQALFVRAEVFRRIGGFPEQPLMEDLELSRRLARVGRIRTVPARVRVSGRRFQSHPLLATVLVNVFPALYRLGVPPRLLARLYKAAR